MHTRPQLDCGCKAGGLSRRSFQKHQNLECCVASIYSYVSVVLHMLSLIRHLHTQKELKELTSVLAESLPDCPFYACIYFYILRWHVIHIWHMHMTFWAFRCPSTGADALHQRRAATSLTHDYPGKNNRRRMCHILYVFLHECDVWWQHISTHAI